MTEVLKQPQYSPLPVEEQVAILWAGSAGFIDDVPVEDVAKFEAEFLENLRTAHQDLLDRIKNEKALSDELIEALTKVTREFRSTNNYGAETTAQAAS